MTGASLIDLAVAFNPNKLKELFESYELTKVPIGCLETKLKYECGSYFYVLRTCISAKHFNF